MVRRVYLRAMAGRVVFVISCGVLALATNHFLFHWVLYSEALLQRFLFGGG